MTDRRRRPETTAARVSRALARGTVFSGEPLRPVVYRESVPPSKLYQSINSPSSSLSIPIFQQPPNDVSILQASSEDPAMWERRPLLFKEAKGRTQTASVRHGPDWTDCRSPVRSKEFLGPCQSVRAAKRPRSLRLKSLGCHIQVCYRNSDRSHLSRCHIQQSYHYSIHKPLRAQTQGANGTGGR